MEEYEPFGRRPFAQCLSAGITTFETWNSINRAKATYSVYPIYMDK